MLLIYFLTSVLAVKKKQKREEVDNSQFIKNMYKCKHRKWNTYVCLFINCHLLLSWQLRGARCYGDMLHKVRQSSIFVVDHFKLIWQEIMKIVKLAKDCSEFVLNGYILIIL